MTFNHVLRGLSLGLLLTVPVAAQNGENYHVMSNQLDVVYAGLGAGGTQVAGVDGIGTWLDGEEMVGNTLTALGDYGYKQAGFANSECVLGPPPAISLNFPMITVIEFNGRNAHNPDVFLTPLCTAGGAPVGITTGGFVPYGFAPATSFNFLLTGLPSGIGVPTSAVQLIPENGLLNTSATATIIAAAVNANLPIASTGFCWVVDFLWAPSALVSLDHVDGWWLWQTNSANGNQYWGGSNDEQNLYQSQTVATDGGASGLIAFFSSFDYEWHSKTQTPAVNTATAPTGSNGAGTYYGTNAAPPCSTVPSIVVNGGFNLGRHQGVSISGAGGALNPATGVSNQNPAGAALPIPGGATLGYVVWDNRLHPLLNGPPAGPGGTGGTAVSWLQISDNALLQLKPTKANNPDVPLPPHQQRLPGGIEAIFGGWPKPYTIPNLLTLRMDKCNATGSAIWPDPWGFPGGTFGIAPVVGVSAFVAPIGNLAPVCAIGFPIVLEAGYIPTTTGTSRGFGAFAFSTDLGTVSTTGHDHLVD